MKSITKFSLLNEKPVVYVSDKALEAIKHIVSIAPQEAQWFHTITETIVDGEKALILSDKLYIPKQNTSAAQVDSTSSMMIEFYNELKQEYSDQNVINEKLNTMTCWCHSHHNMAPNPSSQDVKQFKFFVDSALQQGQLNPQLMLIFNKRDEFYSKLYDPSTGLTYEGLDIVKYHDYDFNYIDLAAKEKFLKPKFKPLTYKTGWGSASSIWNRSSSELCNKKQKTEVNRDINLVLADEFIAKAYAPNKKLSSSAKLKKEEDFCTFTVEVEDCLSTYEATMFYYLLVKDYKSLKSWIYSQTALFNNDLIDYEMILEDICEYLSETKDRVSHVRNCMFNVYRIIDVEADKKSLDKMLEEISA